MTRTNFTLIISNLIAQMHLAGDSPILDWAFRSTEAQQEMFKAGKSKCDGVKKRSRHQDGLAVDIYLVHDESIDWLPDKAKYYHDLWQSWGGKPMIDWDKGHFEV
jgi:hypothetical protein